MTIIEIYSIKSQLDFSTSKMVILYCKYIPVLNF